MNSEIGQWIEREIDRATGVQRSQIETAKLLATIAIAVAAEFVATGLQLGAGGGAGSSGVLLIGCSFLALLAVMAVDRMQLVDVQRVLIYSSVQGWTEPRLMEEFSCHLQAASRFNEDVVRWVRGASATSVLFAAIASLSVVLQIIG